MYDQSESLQNYKLLLWYKIEMEFGVVLLRPSKPFHFQMIRVYLVLFVIWEALHESKVEEGWFRLELMV